jgi:hypothetical protein
MKTLFLTTAAFAALVMIAPIGAHAEYVDPHANVVTACPLSDLGQQRLTDGLTEARYNFSSRAFIGFRGLGFSDLEWTRSSDDQMGDVTVRTARTLSQLNDGALIPVADARGLRSFFYDDTLVCLKNAYHETDAERSERLNAQAAAAEAAKERAEAAETARQKELALEAQQQAVIQNIAKNPGALPDLLRATMKPAPSYDAYIAGLLGKPAPEPAR